MNGVERVEQLASGRFRVHVADAGRFAEQVAEQLAGCAAEHGWRLYELVPERMSLEQVFVSITSRDAAHEVTA